MCLCVCMCGIKVIKESSHDDFFFLINIHSSQLKGGL